MPSRSATILIVACIVVAGSPVRAWAQGTAPAFDPAQLPEMRGIVRHYTLTPRGDIDGLVLEDGTEINLPPHLTPEIAFAIRPGDAVTIHGLRARALPLVAATSIRNDASGRTVIDRGPRLGLRPDQERTVTGTIATVLHGPRAEVNGVLLEDGTTVRLPPDDEDRAGSAGLPEGGLSVGRRVTARGIVLETLLGSVLDATAIGVDEAGLTEVRRPPGRGPDRRGPDRDGPPRPPGPPRP